MKKFVISILDDAITSGSLMVLRASKEFAVGTCNACFALSQARGCDDGDCLRKDVLSSQRCLVFAKMIGHLKLEN